MRVNGGHDYTLPSSARLHTSTVNLGEAQAESYLFLLPA